MGHQFKSLGPVGGAGKSATPDGFNAGPMIAAEGGYSGKPDGATQKDLRGGNAPSGSGYKQGPMFAASTKSGGGGSKDVRSANAPASVGYKQGPMVAAKTK